MQDTKDTSTAYSVVPELQNIKDIGSSRFCEQVSKNWSWIALRGALGIIFGFLAIMWPLATIWALAILWGLFALSDGVSAFMASWDMHKKGSTWWPYLIFGFIGLAAGIITLLWPAITAFVLIYVVAFWAIFGGISQLVAAIRLRKEVQGEWLLGFAGIIGIFFGLLILLRPLPQGVLAIAWVIGLYAIITGCIYLVLSIRIKNCFKPSTVTRGPHTAG